MRRKSAVVKVEGGGRHWAGRGAKAACRVRGWGRNASLSQLIQTLEHGAWSTWDRLQCGRRQKSWRGLGAALAQDRRELDFAGYCTLPWSFCPSSPMDMDSGGFGWGVETQSVSLAKAHVLMARQLSGLACLPPRPRPSTGLLLLYIRRSQVQK